MVRGWEGGRKARSGGIPHSEIGILDSGGEQFISGWVFLRGRWW